MLHGLRPVNINVKYFMKYLLKCIFVAHLSCLVIGCQERGLASIDTCSVESIDLQAIEEKKISEVVDNVRFVQLSSSEKGSLLVNSTKTLVYKGDFYFLDPGQNAILVFNESGGFKYRIENSGNVKNGMELVYDFNINEYTGLIEIMSPTGKIISYDVEKKEYESILPVNSLLQPVYGFYILNENLILYYSNLKEKLVYLVSRESGSIVASFIVNNISKEIDLYHPPPFFKVGDEVMYFDHYSSTKYSLSGLGVECKVEFDYKSNGVDVFSSELSNEIQAEGGVREYFMSNNFFFPIWEYFEDDEIVFLAGNYRLLEKKILLKNRKLKKWYNIDFFLRLGGFYL